IGRHGRADHLAVMADERIGKPQEHARLLRDFPSGLARVRAVVDAGAGDHVRIRNYREEFDGGELVLGARIGGGLLDAWQKPARQRLAQVDRLRTEQMIHGDDPVTADDAVSRIAIDDIACKFHEVSPYSSISRSTGRQLNAERSTRFTAPLITSTSA